MADHVEAAAAGAGRIIVGRLHPGSDMIRGLERACDEHGVRFAAVLSCYGSLSSAGFKFLQIPETETHPRLMAHRVDKRVEFMGGQGLICEDETGAVLGGHFDPGQNPVFNNMDFVLQELLGVRLVREHDPVTNTVEMRVEVATE